MKAKASHWISEFRRFALKGNVIDMAVGVIIGGAFGKIVSSLVNDVLMPGLAMLCGGTKGIGELCYRVSDAADAPVIRYGAFIQTTIDFLLIALTIFIILRVYCAMVSRLHRGDEPAKPTDSVPPPVPEDVALLREIRDALTRRC